VVVTLRTGCLSRCSASSVVSLGRQVLSCHSLRNKVTGLSMTQRSALLCVLHLFVTITCFSRVRVRVYVCVPVDHDDTSLYCSESDISLANCYVR
jgi:hypothetical protein